MNTLKPKKFKYKNGPIDSVIVGIIIFTLVCIGIIAYGTQFFSSDTHTANPALDEQQIELRQQIEEALAQ